MWQFEIHYKLVTDFKSTHCIVFVFVPKLRSPTQHGPGVDHYLQVEVLPVHLLGVAVVDPLGARDVGQVLQHDQVLALNTKGEDDWEMCSLLMVNW